MGDPSHSDAVKAITEGSPISQPDLSIRLLPRAGETLPTVETAEKGINLFNQAPGNINAGQQLSVLATNNVGRSFAVKIKNTGGFATGYKVTLPAPPAGYTVQLLSALESGIDISVDAANTTGWMTPRLEPGASLELKLTATPGLTAGGDCTAVVQAFAGELHDGVAATFSLQNIAKLQWRTPDTDWTDVTPDTVLSTVQGVTIGLRAVKRQSEQSWVDSSGETDGTVPTWQVETNSLDGEEVWFAMQDATADGEDLSSVPAQCGNTRSVLFRVRPNIDDMVLTSDRSAALVGSGPTSLKEIHLTAQLTDINGNAPVGIKVRFTAVYGDNSPAGSFDTNGSTSYLGVVGTDGQAHATWAVGTKVGRVTFRAEALDFDGTALNASDTSSAAAADAYIGFEYGAWTADADGHLSRSVKATAYFRGQKVSGRTLELQPFVLMNGELKSATMAPLDLTTGTSDANGEFTTTQHWNPGTYDILEDFDISVATVSEDN